MENQKMKKTEHNFAQMEIDPQKIVTKHDVDQSLLIVGDDQKEDLENLCTREETNDPAFQSLFKNMDINEYSARHYLTSEPPEHSWLLKNSFIENAIGVIVGPPGSGKGMLALQLCFAVASNTPLLNNWQTMSPKTTLYISAEDDAITMHQRIHSLNSNLNICAKAKERIKAIPLSGDVSLFDFTQSSNVATPNKNFKDLEKIIVQTSAKLIVLDTVARFLPINESDNPRMTSACGHLDALCKKYNCNIVLIHHTDKATGSLAADDKAMVNALEQTALRGFTALTASSRWQLNIIALSQNLAAKKFGSQAKDAYPGKFVAFRVAKKNAGIPEKIIYAQRSSGGVLEKVNTIDQIEVNYEELIHYIVGVVLDLSERGLPALSKTKGWDSNEVLKSKMTRNEFNTALSKGIEENYFAFEKKSGGKGEVIRVFKSSDMPCDVSDEPF